MLHMEATTTRTKVQCERCGRRGDTSGMRLVNDTTYTGIADARFVCANWDACARREKSR
jgi:hypothetical protein